MERDQIPRRVDDLREIKARVGSILEAEFKVDTNKREKLVEGFFSEKFLPLWYFTSNSPEVIAEHIYILTHFLSANEDMVRQEARNTADVTYFVNVGRDYPGRLLSILRENRSIEITGLDSEITASGMRIVTLLKDNTLNRERYESHRGFLNFFEEKNENFLEIGGSIYDGTLCLLRTITPNNEFLVGILEIVRKYRLNMQQTYYNIFEEALSQPVVGLIVLGFNGLKLPDNFKSEILSYIDMQSKNFSHNKEKGQLERLIRDISSVSQADYSQPFFSLKRLCQKNLEQESYNFYLNGVTDFLHASSILFISEDLSVLRFLLGFESLDEFYVRTHKDGVVENRPGYRIAHSRLRGPAKGGLRIDNIVDFCEVAALSFMMTWKSARSGILFGGAKGGLMLNPKTFDTDSIDYFDTISSFGRSLFLVTGSMKDVPAGDVGCGGREIGFMFEGFKAGLRDLALLVYGVKDGISMIGDRYLSVEDAKEILRDSFDIDYNEKPIIEQLCGRQEYLELVVASQITGKPKMGIDARTGATGRGLCYALLATVANLYLAGRWDIPCKLDDQELLFLKEFSSFTEQTAIERDGFPISEDYVSRYFLKVFTALLRGKKVVVQGSGKVGASILEELVIFGVDLIAVADAGGAVIGKNLDAKALLAAVEASNQSPDPSVRSSVVNISSCFEEKILGAAEGSHVLELDCDILIPAALENAISERNADKIKAKIVLCGSNGSNTSIAERILQKNGIVVVYDFLANGAGVTASYFEWLTNLNSRFKYEAEHIYKGSYDDSIMDSFIMPVYLGRVKKILRTADKQSSTEMWNSLLRDIMVSSVNEDFQLAAESGISCKDAGFIRAQLRVLAKAISLDKLELDALRENITPRFRNLLDFYLEHPEIKAKSFVV
ncbi:MAG: Glu/Leu/Phe/Val dehydrogenase [Spirochaetales bacterium]|nr:Glu/Leu/Phe/Val dehydrogenase [Spirochaetales bacterium]